jgi:hypothetical protein
MSSPPGAVFYLDAGALRRIRISIRNCLVRPANSRQAMWWLLKNAQVVNSTRVCNLHVIAV